MHVFEGGTANAAWHGAVSQLLTQPDDDQQSGRGGATRELMRAALVVHEPQQRWLTLRTPPLNPAFAVAELAWILGGHNDAGFLNFWNRQLPRYAGHGTTYAGAYGYRLRQQFGFDQLDRAYHALMHNPDSRQVVLQLWDGRLDFPNEDGTPQNSDIPCNLTSLLKIRRGRLEWTQIMRSNDAFRGIPYNFIQFMTLQEVMAGWLSIPAGSYTHYADSFHAYEVDCSRLTLTPQDQEPPTRLALNLSKGESDVIWQSVDARLRRMAQGTPAAHLEALVMLDLPESYQDLLRPCAMLVAWRAGEFGVAEHHVHLCRDPALQALSSRWLNSRVATGA